MKKYIVQSYVNNDASDYWEFENLEEAKQDFAERVSRIPSEMKSENRQSVVKFDDDDSWGYELYIEDDQGEVLDNCPEEMKNVKVVSLNGENNVKELIPYGKEQEPITLSPDGKFHLSENNAYGFNIPEIEKYLRKADGSYKENTKVFIKVTSTIFLYGKEESNESWASVNLKQRQLFDLD